MKRAAWIFIILASRSHVSIFLAFIVRCRHFWICVSRTCVSPAAQSKLRQVHDKESNAPYQMPADDRITRMTECFWFEYDFLPRATIHIETTLVFDFYFLFSLFLFIFFSPPQRSSFSKFDALQKQNLANVRTGEAVKLNVNVFICVFHIIRHSYHLFRFTDLPKFSWQ